MMEYYEYDENKFTYLMQIMRGRNKLISRTLIGSIAICWLSVCGLIRLGLRIVAIICSFAYDLAGLWFKVFGGLVLFFTWMQLAGKGQIWYGSDPMGIVVQVVMIVCVIVFPKLIAKGALYIFVYIGNGIDALNCILLSWIANKFNF